MKMSSEVASENSEVTLPFRANVYITVITNGSKYFVRVGIKDFTIDLPGADIETAGEDSGLYIMATRMVYRFDKKEYSPFLSDSLGIVISARDSINKDFAIENFVSSSLIENVKYPAFITPLPQISGNQNGVVEWKYKNSGATFTLANLGETEFNFSALELRTKSFTKTNTPMNVPFKKKTPL